MGTVWLKKRYLPSDYDPLTHELVPGAIAPGLYCEDETSFDRILSDPGIERMYAAPRDGDRPRSWPPLSLGGIRVRVATPAEAALFRAMPDTRSQPDPEPDIEAAARQVNELIGKQGKPPAPEPVPPSRKVKAAPFRVSPPLMLNRAAKRRAASKNRRKP